MQRTKTFVQDQIVNIFDISVYAVFLQLLNLVTAVYKQPVAKRLYLCSNKILLMDIDMWISCSFLLLLSRLSRVRLCATPEMAAHQASPSLGFSRQEHWSGLPFPSPMHESEKWKWSHSVMSDSSWPHGLQPTRLLCPWDFPGKSTGVGCHCLLQYYGWGSF